MSPHWHPSVLLRRADTQDKTRQATTAGQPPARVRVNYGAACVVGGLGNVRRYVLSQECCVRACVRAPGSAAGTLTVASAAVQALLQRVSVLSATALQ